jgi:hypothetical protein
MARDLMVTVRRLGPRRDAWPAAAVPASGAAATLWTAAIGGEPTARSRMHDVVLTDGVARLIKSRPARLWQSAALTQLRGRRPERPLAVELALECRLWSERPQHDFDLALLLEVLERAAVIAGARQIREQHVWTAVDAAAPRLLVRLSRFGGAP